MNAPKRLIEYKENVTSQYGEDGILRELFSRIGTVHRIAVEFGAWDGKVFSNTWDLWHNHGWKAYLFEADEQKCRILKEATSGRPHVVPENRFIRPEGPDSLDEVLLKHGLPQDFDLLSIDIDGDDFYVLKNLQRFRPRVIVVEYNPTIPTDYEVVQSVGGCLGASALAMLNLATKIGYGLVAATNTNLILVTKSVLVSNSMTEEKLEDVLPNQDFTYLITDYQGNTYLSKLPGYDIKAKRLNLFNAVKVALRHRQGEPSLPISNKKLIPIKVFKAGA